MNWDKFYIITLDKGGLLDSFDSKKFHKQLTSAKGIKAWWHYLESTYIIKVEFGVTAHNIAEYIQKIAPKKKFFASEINFNNYNGWLTQEAWDWIKKHKNGY